MYGSYGGGYANAASGFATNIAYSTSGGSDTAYFYDSPGNDTFYAYGDYDNSGKPLAGMYGSYGGGYSNAASGFATNIAYSTSGGSDTASSSTRLATIPSMPMRDYDNSGKPSAGMYGSYGGSYSNAANGFSTNIGYSTSGGSDTAYFYRLAGQRHLLCLRRLQWQRKAVGRHVRQLRRRVFQFRHRLRRTSDMRPAAAMTPPFSAVRPATMPSTRTWRSLNFTGTASRKRHPDSRCR